MGIETPELTMTPASPMCLVIGQEGRKEGETVIAPRDPGTSSFQDVEYVFIDSLAIPVNGKMQSRLAPFNTNGDRFLTINDLCDFQALTCSPEEGCGDDSPENFCLSKTEMNWALAEAYLSGWTTSKSSISKHVEGLLQLAHAKAAIDNAVKLVEWLKGLTPGYTDGRRLFNPEWEFTTLQWSEIQECFGVHGEKWQAQIEEAWKTYVATLELNADQVTHTPSHHSVSCRSSQFSDTCPIGFTLSVCVSSVFFTPELTAVLHAVSRDMGMVLSFAGNTELECDDSRCPESDEFPRTFPANADSPIGIAFAAGGDCGSDATPYIAFGNMCQRVNCE